jgi:hypothetical protein
MSGQTSNNLSGFRKMILLLAISWCSNPDAAILTGKRDFIEKQGIYKFSLA